MERQAKVEPYRIPLLSEIHAIPHNGLTVVSTFTGAGGSCLGFRWAGFRTVWASEFVPAAADTYRLNFPDVWLDRRDIRQVTAAEIRRDSGVGDAEVDVLEGSPPCASFSMSGRREHHWGQVRKYSDTEQRVDDLLFEYIRILGELKPRVFVAENVPGLARGKARGFFLRVLSQMRDCGYDVIARVLDAQWLGVPQQRARLIFCGVRSDVGRPPSLPSPLPYRYTLADALPDLRRAQIVKVSGWKKDEVHMTNKPCPTVQAHGVAGSGPHQVLIDQYAVGREAASLAPGEQSKRYFNLVRAHPDKPCPTVTQTGGNPSAASVVHPTEYRKFTIPELKRISGFPDDFELTGSPAQQWERVGRAVPPPMMHQIASHLRDKVLS